jgi:integrase
MANILERKSKKGSSFLIRISLGKDKYSGKYQYHTETFKGDKKAAGIRAKELEVQIANGELYQSKGNTLNELIESFLEMKKPHTRISTFNQYLNTLNNHLGKELGNKKTDELTPEIFDKFFSNKFKSGLSGTSIHHIYKNAKTCLNFGVDRELLKNNPLNKVIAPKRDKPELNIPSPEQVNMFVEYFKKNSDWAYYVTQIAIRTGMRRGEILGLKWSDINTDTTQIHIERNIVDVGGKLVLHRGKTKDSIRTIYTGKGLISELENWRAEQEDRCNAFYNRSLKDDDFIFHNFFSENRDYPIYNPTSFTTAWNRAQKRLDLQGIRFHDLRHFHAIQLLISGNANIKDIQNRLGHSDSKITMDTYMRYIPEDRNKKVGEFADNILAINEKVIEGEIVQK